MQRKPILGFSLALLASITWGTLPLAAHQVLYVIDAPTLVWSRFVVAALVLLLILGARKNLPAVHKMSAKTWGLLILSVLGLALNFTLFSQSLTYIAPTTTQVLWQLAPFTMIICGVVIFGEKMGRFQKIGFGLLIIGLIAFFNDHFDEILQLGRYATGIALGASAAMIWVVYGLAQKWLLPLFSSPQILLMIYTGCAIALLPLVSPAQLLNLDGAMLGFFVYCCANTLIGYGAYGEALNHWDTSKISVITTMLPIFTMIFALLGHALFPTTFAAVDMNGLAYIGALVVVCGAILAVAGDKLWQRKNT